MRMKQVWTLYRKEWLGVMRDRKTILTLVLMSLVLYPVLFGVIGLVTKSQQEKQEASTPQVVVRLEDGESRSFENLLKESSQVQVVQVDDPAQALRDREVDAVVHVKSEKNGNLRVTVDYDERYADSKTARDRVSMVADVFKGQEVARRLAQVGVSTEMLEPIAVIPANIAGTDEEAGMMTSLLPYILAIGLIAGSMNLGVEITAGEKERGTITTLLVSQLSRAEIALGKVLTTVTMAILSVVLNLVSLVLGMLLLARATGEELPTGLLDVLSVSSILELLVVLLPFGCMVSAGIVLLGTFARNSKEGNLYVLPLFFLVMALGMASSGMDASVGVGLYAVPFMGPLLAIKQVILSTDHVAGFVVAVLSSLVYTVMLIWPAVRLYQREEVLFRM